MKITNSDKQQQFIKEGFYLFENILEPEILTELRLISDKVLSQQEEVHFEQQRTTGSMVMIDWEMIYEYNGLTELIAYPKMLAASAELGFDEPKFGHGRIIRKPSHSPPLFWHEDGRFWDDPVSYTSQPIQCFLMYYLTDTNIENGCLRVIPGSHLKRHPLHDRVSPHHTDELRRFTNPDDIAFQCAEGEIDVPVKAGDLVMGYGTLFHAAHANQTNQSRTVLTMWYYPDFVNLPECTQATVAYLETCNRLTAMTRERKPTSLEPLRIVYTGDAEPIKQQWTPSQNLR